MSYIVEQERKGKIYVYEAFSYRNRNGEPRQKRRYLGVKDKVTGEIRKVRKEIVPRISLDFGPVWILYNIGKDLQLCELLEEKLGKELGRRVLCLGLFSALGENALYLYKEWAETTWGVERRDMSSQQISRLLVKLGSMEKEREGFWREWARMHGSGRDLFFDITSISGYSSSLNSLEWGYNRDGESLPQINIGLAVGETNMLPLAYRIYPGSIPDIKVILNLVHYFRALSIESRRIILDRGFFSFNNIKILRNNKFSFVIGMPFTSKKAISILQRTEKEVLSPLNIIQFNERFIGHARRMVNVGGIRCEAHIFHDEKRTACEKENLMRKILLAENMLSGNKFDSLSEAIQALERIAPGCRKYFEISLREGTLELKRNKSELENRILRMGKMIILCGEKGWSPEQILHDYYRKDFLEKFFDTYKNEINQNRLRIHSQDAMYGRIFVAMIALILRGALEERLRHSSELKNKMSIPEILTKIKAVRVVRFSDGKLRTTEMTSKHKKIFEELNIKEPPLEFL